MENLKSWREFAFIEGEGIKEVVKSGSDYNHEELQTPLKKILGGIISFDPLFVWCSDCGGIRKGNCHTYAENSQAIYCFDCDLEIASN